MAEVIAGQEEVGRPIGLEKGIVESCFGQFIFVRINKIDIGARLQNPRRVKKRIRLELVVVIEEADPLATRFGHAAIRRNRNAAGLFEAHQADARVACGLAA